MSADAPAPGRPRPLEVVRGLRRRFGAVVGLTLASQVLSAVSTLVLPLLGLDVADTYAIATQVGLSSLTGVVMGIVYNLAIGRPGFRGWVRWAGLAAGFSVALAGVQLALLLRQEFFTSFPVAAGAVVLGGFGLGGAALSVAGLAAVRLACLGRPRLLAGVTVLPNAGLLVAVLALVPLRRVLPSGAVQVLPMVLWSAASVALALIAVRAARAVDDTDLVGDRVPAPAAAQAGWLAVGVVTSTVMPTLYMAAVAALPAGVPYVLYLTAKIGNSATALAVSSVLMVRYTWAEDRPMPTRLPAVLAASAVAVGALGVGVRAAGWAQGGYVLVVVAWILLLVPSSMVVRELNARRLTRALAAKTTVDLLAAGCAAVLLTRDPSFTGYFGAFAVSLGVTVGVGGAGLRSRALTVAGGAGVALAGALLVAGW